MATTPDDWFKGTETFVTVLHKMSHDKDIKDFPEETRPLVRTYRAMLDQLNKLVNSPTWEARQLLPMDAASQVVAWHDVIEPSINNAALHYRVMQGIIADAGFIPDQDEATPTSPVTTQVDS